ncbi:MAG: pentapeptide repeat-containing protein [Patescibacteria group bacterium]|nr:pentapeptide repeat-containing protein [Patescibacteria group bacterium]
MISPQTTAGQSPENLPEQPTRQVLSREEVAARLERGEHLEKVALTDLNLAGLNLRGCSFCGSDVRGLKLFDGRTGELTDIRETDWTNADFADFQKWTVFDYVQAKGARFGFSESLADRKARLSALRAEGKTVLDWRDGGMFLNFHGREADFAQTTWTNINMAGSESSGLARFVTTVLFDGASLINARFIACDMSGINLSKSNIKGIRIEDPVGLAGLRITEEQVEDIADGIVYTDSEQRRKLFDMLEAVGKRRCLTDHFGAVIAGKDA